MRASLSDEPRATLTRQAEDVLAREGVARARLGYDILVKRTLDELLEREYPWHRCETIAALLTRSWRHPARAQRSGLACTAGA
jgi:hypothetical protein